MKIKFLPAFNGDSILITFMDNENQERNILIDGGTPKTYNFLDKSKGKTKIEDLKTILKKLRKKGNKIDLLILTHIDEDHIGGLLRWFSLDKFAPDLIGKIWFNSAKLVAETLKIEIPEEELLEIEFEDGLFTGVSQAIKFEEYIGKHNLWDRKLIKFDDIYNLWGATLTILSPNELKLDALKSHWMKESVKLFTGGTTNFQ